MLAVSLLGILGALLKGVGMFFGYFKLVGVLFILVLLIWWCRHGFFAICGMGLLWLVLLVLVGIIMNPGITNVDDAYWDTRPRDPGPYDKMHLHEGEWIPERDLVRVHNVVPPEDGWKYRKDLNPSAADSCLWNLDAIQWCPLAAIALAIVLWLPCRVPLFGFKGLTG
jgi:hypothetical protein